MNAYVQKTGSMNILVADDEITIRKTLPYFLAAEVLGIDQATLWRRRKTDGI